MVKRRSAKHPFGVPCSRSLREYLRKKYNLTTEEDFRLFEYIAFTGQKDDTDSCRTVVTQTFMQSVYGSQARVVETLQRFEQGTGLPLHIERAKYWLGLATTVRPEFDSVTIRLIETEPAGTSEDKIDLVTGERFSKSQMRRIREEQIAWMRSYTPPARHPATQLVKHLNSDPVRKTVEALRTANRRGIVTAIETIEDADKRNTAARRYLAGLNEIVRYRDVPGSSRIYAAKGGLLNLPKGVRSAALAGCISLDLRFAQVSIVATLWDAPTVKQFIEDGGDFWERLIDDLGCSPSDKDDLKTLTYMAVFGATEYTMIADLPHLARRFLKHPFVRELMDARRAKMREIADAGGVEDAFGKWWSLDDVPDKRNTQDGVRHLLARQAQSYELAIMLAAFEAIRDDTDLRLVAWEHDGLYFKMVHNHRTRESKIEKLKKALTVKAKELGIAIQVRAEVCGGEISPESPAEPAQKDVESAMRKLVSQQRHRRPCPQNSRILRVRRTLSPA